MSIPSYDSPRAKIDRFQETVDGIGEGSHSAFDYVNEICLYFILNKSLKLFDFGKRSWRYHALLSIPNLLFMLAVSFSLPLYLLLFTRQTTPSGVTSVYVLRDESSYRKVKGLLDENVLVISASLDFRGMINRYGLFNQGFKVKLLSCFFIPAKTLIDFFAVFLLASKHLRNLDIFEVISFYALRIPHKVAYEFFLRQCLGSLKGLQTLYTTNKDCRFAGIDIKVADQLNLRSICYPHGLEYGFKLPSGVPGDKFYCLSEKSRNMYSKIYGDVESKFVFDERVVSCLFDDSFQILPSNGIREVVYFTESRRPEVNVKIISLLADLKLDLKVKLHPKDRESNYQCFDNLNLVESVSFRVDSICVGRKSTVLLEALHHGLTSISVLIDKDDRTAFEVFPSLSDPRLIVVNDINELAKVITEI